MSLSTVRSDSASRVSRSRGRASGRPAAPARGRFIERDAGRDCDGMLGEDEGEADILSSSRRSSSSAFLFRPLVEPIGSITASKAVSDSLKDEVRRITYSMVRP